MKTFKETLDEALVSHRLYYNEDYNFHEIIFPEEEHAEAVLKAAQTMQKLLPLLEKLVASPDNCVIDEIKAALGGLG